MAREKTLQEIRAEQPECIGTQKPKRHKGKPVSVEWRRKASASLRLFKDWGEIKRFVTVRLAEQWIGKQERTILAGMMEYRIVVDQ